MSPVQGLISNLKRPPAGVSLARLLELGPLTAPEAVAVTLELFAELRRQAADGRQGDAFGSREVLVANDGRVMLLPSATVPLDEGESGADVRAVGHLACAALGVSDHPGAPVALELTEPELVVAARALAQGALGRSVDVAERGFRQRVWRLAEPAHVAESRLEVGRLVVKAESGGLGRTAAPPAPVRLAPPAARRPATPRRRPSGLLTAATLVALLLAGVAFAGATRVGPRARPSAQPAPPAPVPATPAAPALAAPAAQLASALREVPDYGPAAAGALLGVTAAAGQPCQAGGTCAVEISISYSAHGAAADFAWEVHAFDRCNGTDQVVERGNFAAPAGWNHIRVVSPARVPAGYRGPVLVVVTDSPDVAASRPLEIAAPAC